MDWHLLTGVRTLRTGPSSRIGLEGKWGLDGKWLLVAALTGALSGPGWSPGVAAAAVLARVKSEGLLRCGVTRSGTGLSETDEQGEWRGFFPEFCRALAAAATGEADAVEFVEVDDVVRFEALRDGAFDVLIANTTWTTTRDTSLGLSFTGTLYYDGQSFLAHRSLGASRLDEVTQASVCVSAGTTTIQNLRELAVTKPGLKILDFKAIDSVYDAFFARSCDLLTYDRVTLLSQLHSRAGRPEEYTLFPDVISKEPLGPVVKAGDKQWFDVVRWTMFALIAAEELGVGRSKIGRAHV